MVKKTRTGEVNKSQLIRDLLTANPEITGKEVAASLAKKGLKVSPNMFYFIKGRMKGRKGRQKKARQMVEKVTATMGVNGAVPAKTSDVIATILKVKHLAAEVGGLRKLNALVEALGNWRKERSTVPTSNLRKAHTMARARFGVVATMAPFLMTFALVAQETSSKDGATALYNGKDLTGWGYKSGEKFDGKAESDDKRFSAKDGMIVVNPGKGIKQLWTTSKFPNDFELRLEFRAAVNADSGLFLRGPQLQVRDYLVAGPYKNLKKYKPQDWNEIVVIVKGTVAHCTCNGEILEDAMKVPTTGGIGLEADRGQMEYRNIRLKETK